MRRTFLIAAVTGAVLTLAALASIDLADLPQQTAQPEPDGTGGSGERWIVEARDRLAATGDVPQPLPAGIAGLSDPRLEGVAVATMKVRNAGGEVIGVASRIAAAERPGGSRAVWWTFVMGARGTLAAHVAEETRLDDGRLLGGTRSFEGATGRFVEQPLGDGGYRLRIVRQSGGSR